MIFKHTKITNPSQQSIKEKIHTFPQSLIQHLLNLLNNFRNESMVGKLLTVLFFIIPWNLGKHFEFSESYVYGFLSPYLIPTLYVQDLLIFVLCAAIIVSSQDVRKLRNYFDESPFGNLILLFLVSCFFSLFFADRFLPSLYLFLRIFFYLLFLLLCVDFFKRDFVRKVFFTAMYINLVGLSLLGLWQFRYQKSLFDNYLFFGEQPYNNSSLEVPRKSYDGVAKIPPHGLFVHPNIYAGYLSVTTIILLGGAVFRERKIKPKKSTFYVVFGKTFYVLGIFLGFYLIFLSKSFVALYATVFGVFILVLYKVLSDLFLRTKGLSKINPNLIRVAFSAASVIFGITFILGGLLLPFFGDYIKKLLPSDSIYTHISVERRISLLKAAYTIIPERPFYGWGLNSFVYKLQEVYPLLYPARFLQPVHNVYVLLASEVGIFGALCFVTLTLYGIFYSFKSSQPVFGIALLEIIVLSSFDHYFITIHQTFLLFILTLGFALTYTKDTNCL